MTAGDRAAGKAAARQPPVARGGQPPQPQAPPQHPPPLAANPLGPPGPAPLLMPPTATVDSSFTVSSWPSGQAHGAEDSLIGRVTSNVEPQARHRYS